MQSDDKQQLKSYNIRCAASLGCVDFIGNFQDIRGLIQGCPKFSIVKIVEN
jgi:hypothetical protein